jgi:hypothetical protein
MMPTLAAAQSRSSTVFAPPSTGTIAIRTAIVLPDYTIKPLPLLTVSARSTDRADVISGRTDLEGRLSMTLPSGRYTLVARPSQPIGGRTFAWSVPVTVQGSSAQTIELTNANAASDSVAVAVTTPPPPRPATQTAVGPPAGERTAVSATVPSSESAVSPESASSIAGPVARPTMTNAAPASEAVSRANTSGFFIGLALNGSAIRADKVSSSTESGGGLALQLGWGFTKQFAMFIDGSAARIASDAGDYDLAHFDIGARWHFVSPSRALVPFLEVGLTGRAASEQGVYLIDDFGNSYQGDLSIQGSGFSFGGGLQYFVAPAWALGGTLKWTTGTFSRVQFNNVSVDGLDLDATSARFNLGFTWYPMGGKAR